MTPVPSAKRVHAGLARCIFLRDYNVVVCRILEALLSRHDEGRYFAVASASLRDWQSQPHIGAMHLDLTDEAAAALTRELHHIVESDRYPFSPRIRTLRAILAKPRPEPAREPLPPPKVYAPSRAALAGRAPRRPVAEDSNTQQAKSGAGSR